MTEQTKPKLGMFNSDPMVAAMLINAVEGETFSARLGHPVSGGLTMHDYRVERKSAYPGFYILQQMDAPVGFAGLYVLYCVADGGITYSDDLGMLMGFLDSIEAKREMTQPCMSVEAPAATSSSTGDCKKIRAPMDIQLLLKRSSSPKVFMMNIAPFDAKPYTRRVRVSAKDENSTTAILEMIDGFRDEPTYLLYDIYEGPIVYGKTLTDLMTAFTKSIVEHCRPTVVNVRVDLTEPIPSPEFIKVNIIPQEIYNEFLQRVRVVKKNPTQSVVLGMVEGDVTKGFRDMFVLVFEGKTVLVGSEQDCLNKAHSYGADI